MPSDIRGVDPAVLKPDCVRDSRERQGNAGGNRKRLKQNLDTVSDKEANKTESDLGEEESGPHSLLDIQV